MGILIGRESLSEAKTNYLKNAGGILRGIDGEIEAGDLLEKYLP